MAKILIIGIHGFVGYHLAQYLIDKGHHLIGFDRTIASLSQLQADVYTGDICDQSAIQRILCETRPDIVYHLAGVIKSPTIEEFYTTNVLGTITLLESLLKLETPPRVLVTSSSAVYGSRSGSSPITEQDSVQPITHYGISKAAQEMVAYSYHSANQLPIFCTRTFNLVGPRQHPLLACSAFARQIALIEHIKETQTIVTGNLCTQRDFIDVRDAVRAYDLIVTCGKPGQIYNVCSQQAVSLQYCLDVMMKMASVPLTSTIDPSLIQSQDVPMQIGSAERIFTETGWKPEIPLHQSLQDLLQYWRDVVLVG